MIRIKAEVIFPIAVLGTLLACEVPPPPEEKAALAPAEAPSSPPPPPVNNQNPYATGEQSQSEVEEGLKEACRAGHAKKGPMLIEFSAPWCGDCLKLAEMKKDPALAKKLADTPHFVVNVGRFDRHEGLLDDFKIRAIANWQVVGTDSCEAEPGEWKKIARRTLEPRTGRKTVTSGDLVEWLDKHFTGG